MLHGPVSTASPGRLARRRKSERRQQSDRATHRTGGNVYYARTYNWSSTGVATGSTPVTTEMTVPAGLPKGAYLLG